MLTIPMIDYIGSLGPHRYTVWSFSIAKYGPQTGWDTYNPDAGNGVSTAPGNPYITGNSPADASTSTVHPYKRDGSGIYWAPGALRPLADSNTT